MTSRSKILIAIFSIITLFVTSLSFTIRFIDTENRVLLTGSYFILGLILSAVVYLVISAMIKSPEQKPVAATPSVEEEPPTFDEKAARLLAMLQKQGRLIDFLQEDISGFEDGQIGAAVRNIHRGCREALEEYTKVEPVMKEQEGSEIIIESGFDPSAIRLTGNVTGHPPFKGIVRHSGWRVSTMKIPTLLKNQDVSIIEPAEVEIS